MRFPEQVYIDPGGIPVMTMGQLLDLPVNDDTRAQIGRVTSCGIPLEARLWCEVADVRIGSVSHAKLGDEAFEITDSGVFIRSFRWHLVWGTFHAKAAGVTYEGGFDNLIAALG